MVAALCNVAKGAAGSAVVSAIIP